MGHPAHTIVTLDERRDSAGHHVCLRGRLDVHTVPDLRMVLHRIVDDGSDDLLVDLAECEIGDATGFGVLVECLRRARRGSRSFRIVDADPRTHRLLRRARLGHLVGPVEPAVAPAAPVGVVPLAVG
jgi:anti-anti-sigma factor